MSSRLRNTLLRALAHQHSGLSDSRVRVRTYVVLALVTLLLLSAIVGSAMAPAFAYWQTQTNTAVQVSAATVAPKMNVSCVDVSSASGTNPRGVRISWTAVPNAIGYRIQVAFVAPTGVVVPYTWAQHNAVYPDVLSTTTSQHIYTGLNALTSYPAGVPTLYSLLGSVYRWTASEYYGQVVLQVQALYGGVWATQFDTVAIPTWTGPAAVGTLSAGSPGTSATVRFDVAGAITDYIKCAP